MAIKKNLLGIVQNILSDMDSQEVNSISDSIEAMQVAQIVETTFYNIIASRDIPEHESFIKLTALSNTDFPTHFKYPTNVKQIKNLSYDVSSDGTYAYSDIKWLEPLDFINRTDGRNLSSSTVVDDKVAGTKIHVYNDRMPSYYTSFDDDAVVTILTEISTEDNVFDIEDWQDAYDEDDLDKAKEALSMYSHRLKEAQGVFDAEMDVAKETISALIEKAKHEDDTFVQAELTKYQAELTEYQQKVTKEISEYQAKLERYKLELTTVFQAWQNTEAVKVQSYQAELQSYQAEIQNATNEFNEDNANFQAKVQASIQNAQASNQIALQNLQKDLARAQADAQSDSARKLQDAIQTTQALMADNNNILQKFQMEISQYQAEVTSATQESQLKTQQYQMQYVQLKQQYEQGFVPFQVQQEAKQ